MQLTLTKTEETLWPIMETVGLTPVALALSKYCQFREDLARDAGKIDEAEEWAESGSSIDDITPWLVRSETPARVAGQKVHMGAKPCSR